MALAALSVAAACVFLWLSRGFTFYADEWGWLFVGADLRAKSFIDSYNGHLIAPTIAVYVGLATAFGLDDYLPFRLVAVAIHLACVWLVYSLARRRIAEPAAVLAAVPVLFLGVSSDVILSPWAMGTSGALAAGLGALIMLDRRTPRGDLAAAAFLALALASHGVGLALAIGALVEVLLGPSRRRRLPAVVLPLVLYAAWWAAYGEPGAGGAPVIDRLTYFFHLAAAAVAGLGGVQLASEGLHDVAGWIVPLAHVATAAAVGACVLILLRRPDRRSPRLYALLAAAVALWALTAAARAGEGEPYSPRYVYAGAVLIVLTVVELLRGIRLPATAVAYIGAGLVATSMCSITWMFLGARDRRHHGEVLSAELGAVELARHEVSPFFQPDGHIRAGFLTAGSYFNAVQHYGGSPADTPGELTRRPAAARHAADRVLIRAVGLRVASRATRVGHMPPPVDAQIGGQLRRRGGCLIYRPRTGLGAVDVALPEGGITVVPEARRAATVEVRRFGTTFLMVRAGRHVRSAGTLRRPQDGATPPWHARVASSAGFEICSVAEPAH